MSTTWTLYIGSTTLRFLEILPPASSYIIIPPGGIIMYGLAGGTILKSWNFVDTTIQRIPENRKLPYPAGAYYFTYGQAEEGYFPIFGFSLY